MSEIIVEELDRDMFKVLVIRDNVVRGIIVITKPELGMLHDIIRRIIGE